MAPKKKVRKRKRVSLEKIIGCTTFNGHGMDIHPLTGDIAYISGAVAVIYSPGKNKQSNFFVAPQPIQCLKFSPSGKFIAVGTRSTSKNEQGELIIWNITTKKKVSSDSKSSHKKAIVGIDWHPNGNQLVTLGEQNTDKYIKLWKFDGNKDLSLEAVNRSKEHKMNAIAFHPTGTTFLTVGDGSIIFWEMESLKLRKRSKLVPGALIIKGKKAILSNLENHTFVDLACSDEEVYIVTNNAKLALFNIETKALAKWVDLKSTGGYSIDVYQQQYVVIGCAGGTVRIFNQKTLKYVATLPQPPPINSHATNESIDNSLYKNNLPSGPVANAVAVKYHGGETPDEEYITCIYSDRSIFLWNVSNRTRISKYRSFLAHSDTIWDVDMLPLDADDSPLPKGTFVTSSADGTVRLWNINHDDNESDSGIRASIASKDVFCRDMLHVVKIQNNSKDEDKRGVRAVRFSPDGCYIASGDHSGMLRLHDVYQFNQVADLLAHDAEVLAIDVAQHEDASDFILATGSRDRMIHLFSMGKERGCESLDTLVGHSSSITAVKFAKHGTKLISSSADKSIIYRNISFSAYGSYEFDRYEKTETNGVIYDIDVDATQKYCITTCEDKDINIWSIDPVQKKRTYRHDKKGNAEPIRVCTDPAGIHAVTSSADRVLRLYDFYSGNIYAKFRGHAEVITGMKFTRDCKRLITVSADGCIFVWRIASTLVSAMQNRLNEIREESAQYKAQQQLKRMMNSSATLNGSEVMGYLPDQYKPKQEQQSIKLDRPKTSHESIPSHEESIKLERPKTSHDSIQQIMFNKQNLPAWARPKTAVGDGPRNAWAERKNDMSLKPNIGNATNDSNHSFSASMREEEDVCNMDSDEEEYLETPRPTTNEPDEADEQIIFFDQGKDINNFDVEEKQTEPVVPEKLEELSDDEDAEDQQYKEDAFAEEAEEDFVSRNYKSLAEPAPIKTKEAGNNIRSSISAQYLLRASRSTATLNKMVPSPKNNKLNVLEKLPMPAWAKKMKPDSPSSPSSPANVVDESPNTNQEKQKKDDEGDEDDDIVTHVIGEDPNLETPEKQKISSPQSTRRQLDMSIEEAKKDNLSSYAIEAGFGRVSNETFARRFRAAVDKYEPLPPTPKSRAKSEEKGEDYLTSLRELRRQIEPNVPADATQLSEKSLKLKNDVQSNLQSWKESRQMDQPDEKNSTENDDTKEEENIEDVDEEEEGEKLPAPSVRATKARIPPPNVKHSPMKSVRQSFLRKSVDEYQSALSQLKQSFTHALSLYDEAQTDIQESVAKGSQSLMSKEEEEMYNQFQHFFGSMATKLQSRSHADTMSSQSSTTGTQDSNALLERYSEQLMKMVSSQLQAQFNKKQ